MLIFAVPKVDAKSVSKIDLTELRKLKKRDIFYINSISSDLDP